ARASCRTGSARPSGGASPARAEGGSRASETRCVAGSASICSPSRGGGGTSRPPALSSAPPPRPGLPRGGAPPTWPGLDASATKPPSKAVLITGCSTGIGRATAEHLARRGWTVYATARRPESIQDLAATGCRILPLDVCDEASMHAAVTAVEQAEGAVGVLVNNAGYGQEGAFEATPMTEIR